MEAFTSDALARIEKIQTDDEAKKAFKLIFEENNRKTIEVFHKNQKLLEKELESLRSKLQSSSQAAAANQKKQSQNSEEFRQFKRTYDQDIADFKIEVKKSENWNEETRLKLEEIRKLVDKSKPKPQSPHSFTAKTKEVLRTTIRGISELTEKEMYLATINVGDLPWKISCKCADDGFIIIAECEYKNIYNSPWECIATSQLCIVDQFYSEQYSQYSRKAVKAETNVIYHQVPMQTLRKPGNGFIKNDSICISMDINLLSYSGIPTIGYSYGNKLYTEVSSVVSYLFKDISKLGEQARQASPYTFGTQFLWCLSMGHSGITTHCCLSKPRDRKRIFEFLPGATR